MGTHIGTSKIEKKLDEFSKETIEIEILDHLENSNSINKASTVDKGDAFTKWYVDRFLNKNYNLDADDVEDGLDVGGKDDCNIDFIYEDDKANIVVQCKYRGKDSSISKGDLDEFKNLYSNLFKKETAQIANPRLKNYLERIRKTKKTKPIIMQFVYNKRFTSSQKKYIKDFKDEIISIAKKNNYPQPDIEFIGLKKIAEKWDMMTKKKSESMSQTVPIYDFSDDILKLRFGKKEMKTPMWFDMKEFSLDEKGAIVFPISATTLLHILKDFGDSLFDENIRLYQGSGKTVNKNMLRTLKDNPERFFIYNNGISGICSNFEVSRHNINIFGLQVINGAQTIKTIREAELSALNLSNVYVLFKLTTTKNPNVKKNIIQASNSQTSIVPADFRANDEIQIFLNDKLKDYKYLGNDNKSKKLFYVNKRQQIDAKTKKKNITIDLATLTKVLAAIKLGPHISSATSSLFDIEKNYWKIYGDEGAPLDSWNTSAIIETAAIIFVWKRVEYLRKQEIKKLKNETPEKIDKPAHLALLPRFHIIYSYFYLLENKYPSEIKNIYTNIASGKVFDKGNNFIDRWFPIIIMAFTTIFHTEKSFNFRNWQRQKESIENLKNQLNILPPHLLEFNENLFK